MAVQHTHGNRFAARLAEQAAAGRDEPLRRAGPAGQIVSRHPAEDPANQLRARRFRGDPILQMVMENLVTLKKGKRGPQIDLAVQKVQRALIDAGFILERFGPDGIFGRETEAAVKAFQEARGLPPEEQDGKVGPITLGLLDEEYAEAKSTHPQPEDTGGSGAEFAPEPPVNPRYSNPDPYTSIEGDAIRLNGPQYAFSAGVVATGADEAEVRKWDVGHVQDVTEAEIEGGYSDGHVLAFEVSLPVRDEPRERGTPIFPWYDAKLVRRARRDEAAVAIILDDPGAQFPAQDNGAALLSIHMKFGATDWLAARNRNTGVMQFLHHSRWGFDLSLTLDPSKVPAASSDPTVISLTGDLPSPQGTLSPIDHAPGKGAGEPSMTEWVFNEQARLIRR